MTARPPLPLRLPGAGQRGIALLESLLAVVILGIALVGTLALQARSTAALSDAAMRAEATVAANQLIGMMSTDIAHATDYALAKDATAHARLADWLAAVKGRIPGAGVVVTVQDDADTSAVEVDIAISWQRTSSSQRNTHNIKSWLARAT